MRWNKIIDEIVILYKEVFIKALKYSMNNEYFYYNVLTKGGDNLVYKYSKDEHEEIQYIKESEYWRNI